MPGTLDEILRIFAWSMNALLTGFFPAQTIYGHNTNEGAKPLAGGFKGILCQARGDWEFYTQIFKIPRWDGADRMCFKCGACGYDAPHAFFNAAPTRAGET